MCDSFPPHGLQHARLPCPSPTLELAQTHVHRVRDSSQPSHPLLSPSPAFNFSSYQGLFQGVSSLHQVDKVLEFQLQHQPSSGFSELVSFRMYWFDLPSVHRTLKIHSSKASILQCSAFFIVQLSHSYMTTGKTIALTRWTFVGKVMLLLFNVLFRPAIAFLSRLQQKQF